MVVDAGSRRTFLGDFTLSPPQKTILRLDRSAGRRDIGDFRIHCCDRNRGIVRPGALQGLLEIVIGHAEGDLAGDIATRVLVDQHQIRDLTGRISELITVFGLAARLDDVSRTALKTGFAGMAPNVVSRTLDNLTRFVDCSTGIIRLLEN
jgi:hypothetical protein